MALGYFPKAAEDFMLVKVVESRQVSLKIFDTSCDFEYESNFYVTYSILDKPHVFLLTFSIDNRESFEVTLLSFSLSLLVSSLIVFDIFIIYFNCCRRYQQYMRQS